MTKHPKIHTKVKSHHFHLLRTVFELVVIFLIFTAPVGAVTRLTSRSLFIYDTKPSAVTKYKISFTYTTATTVGSVNILFCTDPIPQVPCVAPSGLDVSGAVLSNQAGVTGYSITQRSANHLVLSRTPGAVGNTLSTYTFSNIKNPTDTSHSFAARLSDYASSDASGPVIDLGSVLSSASQAINVEAQVPPMLVFCVAHQVSQDCTTTTGGNFTDLGALNPTNTLTATSQMAASTNASRGYAITVYGNTMSAGTNTIDQLDNPSSSLPGKNQFGINLVANTSPSIGSNPDGSFTNANPTTDYSIPNKYTYKNGSVVASSPNVALVRRYTVSYIINSSPELHPGVYTTTITYICSGRF